MTSPIIYIIRLIQWVETHHSDFLSLLVPTSQSLLAQKHRAILITSRVKLVSWVFCVLTPLWIPIDMFFFKWEFGGALSILRLVVSVFFYMLYRSCQEDGITKARIHLVKLLAIPTVFFLFCTVLMSHWTIENDFQQFILSGYALLPFVMVAGLAIFPITALEGLILSSLLQLSFLVSALLGYQMEPFASHLGAQWLLILITVVSILAGMSQMHFMTRLVDNSSHDALTTAYIRRVGEELLNKTFSHAQNNFLPLSIIFVDLDNFKSVNDIYGHDEGDAVLRNAALAIRHCLRKSDMLIRWGGEEFIILLPHANEEESLDIAQRIRQFGFGLRPDGAPMTASIGLSERVSDEKSSWQDLLGLADKRMYEAKTSGKIALLVEISSWQIRRRNTS